MAFMFFLCLQMHLFVENTYNIYAGNRFIDLLRLCLILFLAKLPELFYRNRKLFIISYPMWL